MLLFNVTSVTDESAAFAIDGGNIIDDVEAPPDITAAEEEVIKFDTAVLRFVNGRAAAMAGIRTNDTIRMFVII